MLIFTLMFRISLSLLIPMFDPLTKLTEVATREHKAEEKHHKKVS